MADNYETMMRDIESTIQARDRDSDTNLRELLATRRKVWEMYPRIAALEDSLMRFSTEDPDDITKLLNEYRGTPSYPANASAPSYSSVTDLGHHSSNPGHTATSTYSARYTKTSNPGQSTSSRFPRRKPGVVGGSSTATSSYVPVSRKKKAYDLGTSSVYSTTTAGRRRSPRSPSYRQKKAYDFETSSVSGYGKPQKRFEDKWETQSMIDIPVKKTRSAALYARPYRSSVGGRARVSDFETASVRSYQDDDDADLESLLRWKTNVSSTPARKTYEDWSPPRYSPRSPLNAYIYEPDLTTSYQSPRTLVDREKLGLEDEEENIVLSRYTRVPLTENAVRRHDVETAYNTRYYGDRHIKPYGYYYTVAHNPGPASYRYETASSYNPAPSVDKWETMSYTPETTTYRPVTRTYQPVISSRSKYDTSTRSKYDTCTRSKYDTRTRSKYDTPTKTVTRPTILKTRKTPSYRVKPLPTYSVTKEYKPVTVTKAKVTFTTPPPPPPRSRTRSKPPLPPPPTTTYRKKYESTTRRHSDTFDTVPARRSARSKYDDKFTDVGSTASYVRKSPRLASDSEYLSGRQYDKLYTRVPRAPGVVGEKRRYVSSAYTSASIPEEENISERAPPRRHFRLGVYKGGTDYYKKGEGTIAEEITLDHLHSILKAQSKLLSEFGDRF
ncbi:adhesive plaque matrix protein-like [Ptychodera flava]|uniref:adhesive plaque matrix protein-like n=1 Tax=Ptychodera flava TaxID=63121 RepID=UPI00396A452E